MTQSPDDNLAVGQHRFKLRPTATAGWIVLALLIATNAPLFVCMPITDDVALYDLQARTLMDGGVLYRDVFEPNLPGVVWIHAGIRTVLGDGVEAIRIADMLIFATIVFLLARWIGLLDRPKAIQAWAAVILTTFYLSVSEWNHCQRDIWLLAPALMGIYLRQLQLQRLTGSQTASNAQVTAWAALEGLCWGAGVWIKPMIVLPALACWLVAALFVRRPKYIAIDFAGLLAGGLIAGAGGILWMHATGAWPFFVETFTEWNPRYFSAGKEHWTAGRFLSMTFRFFPWILVHLVAIPAATIYIVKGIRQFRSSSTARSPAHSRAGVLFAAFYLAWLVQSLFLQHLFDYVHAPAILLGITILAAAPSVIRAAPAWRATVAGFLVIALLLSPVFHHNRLSCWWKCLTEGSTPGIQTKLARLSYPDWNDLDQVAKYLEDLDLKDGELTCFNNDLVHLYLKLGLRPPSRFVYLESLMAYFPAEKELFQQSVINSGQRYVVTDLMTLRLNSEQIQAARKNQLRLSSTLKRTFPWCYPVVFHAGTLRVHQVPPIAKTANLAEVDLNEVENRQSNTAN
ncbi:MAG: hypothetical protein VB835_20745 [Pirellulales bacterium]